MPPASAPGDLSRGVGLSEIDRWHGHDVPLGLQPGGTVGVAAAALTPGGPPDLVALNSGSETIGVLEGLGDGRFANPTTLPTTGPTVAIRIADFNGDGNPDLAILGRRPLHLAGRRQGRVVPLATYDVGSDPPG